jgi:ribosomal protein S21
MKKQRTRKEDMIIVGKPNGFKVVNNDINSALKLWKKYVKDAGKVDILKSKKEYVKPSVVNRKKQTDAEYSQWLEKKRYDREH